MIQQQGNTLASTQPNGIRKESKMSQEYLTEKSISGETKNKIESKSPSTKNIKFIRPSRPSNNLKETKNSQENEQYQHNYDQETPYKLLKASNTHESRNK